MATTDYTCIVQRELAEFAYDLKVKYNETDGLSKESFLKIYDKGEIELSTVFENLIVAVRNSLGIPTQKVSEACRDIDNNADVKIGILKKDGDCRRFVISGVHNKIGTIYFVGWNWITAKPVFFAIQRRFDADGMLKPHPVRGIKIMVHPITGERTRGIYNDLYAHDTFESMCKVD